MTDELRPKRKKKRSAILRGFSKMTDWIYKKATSGFLSRIFSAYTKLDRAFKNSFAVSALGGSSKFASKVRKLRFVVAEQFEESRVLHAWRRFMRFLGRCKLRLYGSFAFTLAIYTALVYFFKRYIMNDLSADSSYITFAVILSLASIPLLLSTRTLAGSVVTSRTGNFIAVKIFGIPLEKFEHTMTRHGDSYNLAIALGIVSGTLTYFIHPMHILAAIAAFASIALVISSPEVGVIAAIVLLPVYSLVGTRFLFAVVITYSISFLIKLLRGKRVVSFEITDLFILIFGLTVLLGGIVSAGDASGMKANLIIILLSGCFIAGNLMRTRQWQARAVLAFGASGYVTSLLVIWQSIAEYAGSFSEASIPHFENGLDFFGNSDFLSAFLLTTFLVTLAITRNAQGKKAGFAAKLSAIVILAALILTDSTVGFIALIFAAVIYFIIMSRNALTAMFFSGLTVSTALMLSPEKFTRGLASFFGVRSDGLNGISNIRMGCYDMIRSSFFSGVGTGAFSEIYSMYAVAGFESVTSNASVWLYVLSEQGIVGAVLLAAILFLVAQNCCEYLRRPFCDSSKALVAAGFASLGGIMIQSVFVNFWSQPSMFFMFWMIPALLTSGIRGCRREREKSHDEYVGNEYSASVDI